MQLKPFCNPCWWGQGNLTNILYKHDSNDIRLLLFGSVFFPLPLYMFNGKIMLVFQTSGKRSDEIIELNNKQIAVFKAIPI